MQEKRIVHTQKASAFYTSHIEARYQEGHQKEYS
jgi:hypothetical protein